MRVMLGKEGGTFDPPASYPIGGRGDSVVVADISSDRVPDLIVANPAGRSISVLLGNSNGSGTFQEHSDEALDAEPGAIAVADLDHDGSPDLIVASRGVSVWPGNGRGGFQRKENLSNYLPDQRVLSIYVVDINCDGNLDVAAATAADHVSVLLGNGDGSLQIHGDFGTGAGPVAIAAADLDADRVPDLVTANSVSKSVSVLLATCLGD